MLAADGRWEGLWTERSCHPSRPSAELPTSQSLGHLPGSSRRKVCSSTSPSSLQRGTCSARRGGRGQEPTHPQVPAAEGEASRLSSQNPPCSFHRGTSGARGGHASLRCPVKSSRSWARASCCSWAPSWFWLNPRSLVVDVSKH